MKVCGYIKVILLSCALFVSINNPLHAQTIPKDILDVLDVQVLSVIINDKPSFRSFGGHFPERSVIMDLGTGVDLSNVTFALRESAQENADQIIEPLRVSVGKFSFRDVFREHLREQLGVFPIKTTGTVLELNTQQQKGARSGSGVQTLEIDTRHFLSNNGLHLIVWTSVGLFYPGTEIAISARDIIYVSQSITETGSSETVIDRWSQRNAELYKHTTVEAVQESLDILDRDVLRESTRSAESPVKRMRINIPSWPFDKHKYDATVIRRKENRLIFQTRRGGTHVLISIPDTYFEE